jgi:hypothetical protein
MAKRHRMRYQRSPRVLWRFTARGVLLLSPADGQLVELNGSGRVMWEALRQPRTLDEAATELGSHFGLPAEQVRAAIRPVLDELVAQCFVDVDYVADTACLPEESGVA